MNNEVISELRPCIPRARTETTVISNSTSNSRPVSFLAARRGSDGAYPHLEARSKAESPHPFIPSGSLSVLSYNYHWNGMRGVWEGRGGRVPGMDVLILLCMLWRLRSPLSMSIMFNYSEMSFSIKNCGSIAMWRLCFHSGSMHLRSFLFLFNGLFCIANLINSSRRVHSLCHST